MSRPTLVFLPGFWEGPAAYSKVLNIINSKHSYPTEVIPLSSTGTSTGDGKDFTSDVVAIRDAISKLANEGQEIVFIMHSAGAYVGSQALKDLGLAHRKQRGEAGGVAKLAYLTGALLPEGMDHPPQPLFKTVVKKIPCLGDTFILPEDELELTRTSRVIKCTPMNRSLLFSTTSTATKRRLMPINSLGNQQRTSGVSISATVLGKIYPASTYAVRKTT